LVWDVENISIKALSSIKHLAKFTPQKCFAISKVPLDALKAAILLKEGFNLYISYPYVSDDAIIDFIDTHHHGSSLIFISSDSDFVPVINRFLHKHSVQWIMQDCNKKRICMYINLSHPRLTLSSLDIEDERGNRHSKKRKKTAFYAPTRTSFANEVYWLNYFSHYYAHIG
jgi:hypothetical protein